MNKRYTFITVAGFLLMLLAGMAGHGYASTVHVPAEKIVKTVYDDKILIANTPVFGTLEYPAVIFDHDKHTKVLGKEGKGCDTCHPLYEKNQNFINFTFPKNMKDRNRTSPKLLMNAYHTTCIGCHDKRLQEGKKAGPVTCGNCHVKGQNVSKFQYPAVIFDFKLHHIHEKKLQTKEIEELRAAHLEPPVVVRFESDHLDTAQKALIEKKAGEKNCALCHHSYDRKDKKLIYEIVYNKGKEINKAWACEDCHDLAAQKSPLLAADISMTTQKDLSIEKSAHMRCLNCHLIIAREESVDKAGPTLCYLCHERKHETSKELEQIPRPMAGQPLTGTLRVKDAKMKAVPFDHAFHEQRIASCRDCHHETLYSCDKCHTLDGNRNGGNINLFDAYHDIFSQKSCIGCHATEESAKNCSGCHRPTVVAQEPTKRMCVRCHNGMNKVAMPATLTTAGLDPDILKKEVVIKELKNQFKPVKYPHEKILIKLAQVSNDSKLATYFHGNIQTLCEGCHHHGDSNAQIQKDSPPSCGNCHNKYFEPLALHRPRLLAAYHEMCIQCHKQMELKKPKACAECHAFAKNDQGK